jgi:hypothetical protein
MLRSQMEVAWLESLHISIEQFFSGLINARFLIRCLNCYISPYSIPPYVPIQPYSLCVHTDVVRD